MTTKTEGRLYEMLPAIYRVRDDEHARALQALLGILQEQFDVVEQDIAGLYEDRFIETCEEWVVPYIGDLLGVRLLHDVPSGGVYSQRALVANILSYRRRKGSLQVLEDLARDVTGWGAHAVAFFELLGWTQHLNHLRMERSPNPNPRSPSRLNPPASDRVGSVNLRSLDVVDRIDGPFDVTTHTVDIRHPRQIEGWHNLRNAGFFLWRLQSYPLTGIRPEPAGHPGGFHFSPLGHPAPLFNNPKRRAGEAGPAREVHVPGPIRAVAFFQDTRAYYGADADKSLALYRGPRVDPAELIPVERILCKDLGDWSSPPAGSVAVDPVLGRFMFPPGEAPEAGVTATYHYGFSADLGGGPYDRRSTIESAFTGDWEVTVAKLKPEPAPANWEPSIGAAIDHWDRATHRRAVITVADSATYDENLSLQLEGDRQLVVQAADRERPLVRLRDDDGGLSVLRLTGGAGEGAALTLGGLLIEGGIVVDAVSLGRLEMTHCTLVPGRGLREDGRPVAPGEPGLVVADDNLDLEVRIEASITGPLRMPAQMAGLAVSDSIIDAPEGRVPLERMLPALAADAAGDHPGPLTRLERTTAFGAVHVRELHASEVLFVEPVTTRRRQVGCVRYSYTDDLRSITPRRFRCQPDLALDSRRRELRVDQLPGVEATRIRFRVRPDFTSTRYGRPAYAQLGLGTATEIRAGAEDGAEVGAFQQLKQPQREANLRVRLHEFMPYGLEAGFVYVT